MQTAFLDRFAVMHPDEVLSVTAGGLNGMPLIPVEEAAGRTLDYHVGIADLDEILGEPVDVAAVDDVNQFLYMGARDRHDTIQFGEAFNEDLRDLALDVYGSDITRLARSQAVYEDAGVSAQFREYAETKHNPEPALDDIVAFHEVSMNDEDVTAFGEDLAGKDTDSTTRTDTPTSTATRSGEDRTRTETPRSACRSSGNTESVDGVVSEVVDVLKAVWRAYSNSLGVGVCSLLTRNRERLCACLPYAYVYTG